jgi:hypothetical protein
VSRTTHRWSSSRDFLPFTMLGSNKIDRNGIHTAVSRNADCEHTGRALPSDSLRSSRNFSTRCGNLYRCPFGEYLWHTIAYILAQLMEVRQAMKIVFALLLAPAIAAVEIMCPFLSTDSAPPIEFSLPATALATPIIDLPIEFQGVRPIVTRRDVPYGSMPRVIVLRYSAAPSISYDEVTRSVIITSASCSSESSTSSALSTTRYPSTRLMTMAVATCLMGLVDERLRPSTAALALAIGFAGVQAQRVLQEVCMPTVEVIVEAPSAYQGAVATCLAEIKDPIVCPDHFPTYATCSDPAPNCGVVVVGAGAGGLYTALR